MSAEDPETLPWLIKFDKFVDGQDHDGVEELVIRSNVTETALNEAVALDLMELAGARLAAGRRHDVLRQRQRRRPAPRRRAPR
ncbi:MAG: hypothetical protein R2690_11800 [Acidimicrobiales bacterium]